MAISTQVKTARRKPGDGTLQWGVAFVMIEFLVVAALAQAHVAVAAPVVAPWRLEQPWTSRTASIEVGGLTVEAEVADTEPLRERGLGYRDGLKPGTGMLFVYEEPGSRSFWMKGMRFCLDIIWIEAGHVVGAAENVCPISGASDADLPSYQSPEPVRYVLEMPAGWLADHGFSAGTPVTIRLPG
jgi:uncharacterized membrane protein (UPF0127 family)